MTDDSVGMPSTSRKRLCFSSFAGSIFRIFPLVSTFPSRSFQPIGEPTSHSDTYSPPIIRDSAGSTKVCQTSMAGTSISICFSMKRFGIWKLFLLAFQDQPQRAGDDHAVGDVHRGALEDDEVIDGEAVDDAVEQVAAGAEDEEAEGAGQRVPLLAKLARRHQADGRQDADAQDPNERAAQRKAERDAGIPEQFELQDAGDELRLDPRKRGVLQNPVEQEEAEEQEYPDALAMLHTLRSIAKTPAVAGAFAYSVKSFLQSMQEVEVARAIRRFSSIGLLQYLQVP